MIIRRVLILVASFLLLHPGGVWASQASDTTITITGQTEGVTPFISQLTLSASSTTNLQSIQFTVAPKPGSVTRSFSQTYTTSYLTGRNYLQPGTGQIFLPVYGLYASYTNTVALTYRFLDGSAKQATATIATSDFNDPCGIATPAVLQVRSAATDLSYDFMFVRGACGGVSGVSPLILDTDGAVRWVSPFGTNAILTAGSTFFNHAVYITRGSMLYRVDLDGTVTPLKDYQSLGVINFHHQIDPGRTGMILDADTGSQVESVNLEVDDQGNVIKEWKLAGIIRAAMIAGGDDPAEFVYSSPTDWFHNNGVAYRKSDDSLIVSSRENFVIALDYDTDAIQWILGDETKKWFQFPSLAQFSLALDADSHPPIGQHSVSFTHDNDLLLIDNGRNSQFQTPMGINRSYSSPRKYRLDLAQNAATELWNYPREESIDTQFCGSVYEDAPFNYLIDYAFITAPNVETTAQLVGLNASGRMIFDYQYPTSGCNTAYNSLPLHAEQFLLSNVGQTLNLSTRGRVREGENALVGGFIITGFESKDIVLRALGPSLEEAGVSGVLANPVLTVYNSAGTIITSNDDWSNSPEALEIQAQGLAPGNARESAVLRNLAPGAYTFVVSSRDDSTGVALVEAYDLSRNSNSALGNVSTRGFVGTDEDVLISGFIVGSRNTEMVVLRAIGPSLAASGVGDALADPTITLFDQNGTPIAQNDNWQDDRDAATIRRLGLAPKNPNESATLVSLVPGTYTAVVEGVNRGTGVGLVEVYNLP